MVNKSNDFVDTEMIDLGGDAPASKKTKTKSTKKDAKPKNDTPSSWSSFVGFFKSPATHKGIGVLFMSLSLYLLVCAVSYFMKSGKLDQNIVRGNNPIEIALDGENIANWGAAVGAWVTNAIIANGVGIGVFVLVIWGMVIGLRLFRGKSLHLVSFTLISMLSMVSIFMTFGAFDAYSFDGFINMGGNIGYENSMFLNKLIGVPGIVLLIVFLWITLILCCRNNIAMVWNFVKSLLPEKKVPVSDPLDDLPVKADDQPVNLAGFDEDESQDTPEPEKKEDDAPKDGGEDLEDDYLSKYQPSDPIVVDDEASVTTSSVDVETGEIIVAPKIEMANGTQLEAYDPTKDLSKFRFPTLDLLQDIPVKAVSVDINEQEENKKRITDTLLNYGIPIKKIDVCVGPTITLFEIVPADGVRISKIKNLEDDIALSLSALGIRIIAPIPGRGTIGIEVPNKDPQTVSMRSVIGSKAFQECKYELPMALGCTISNEVFVADLAKMPHLLVAGATGQGKSVGLNAIVTSLLYKKHPAELKFVMVDPKQVEFSLYEVLEKHYLAKLPDEENCIITKSEKVVATLNSVVTEMENRYTLLNKARVRTIKEYNKKFINRDLNPENGHMYMPYIVVIIDEFSDLIMEAGKDVERPIVRIAQKARAVGIHMIIATQRPSTNVITGLIKANFPGRVAFRVTQMVDSRTILDCSGAQQLVGKGDMLFSAAGAISRVQCAFVDTPEVEHICDYIADQVGYAEAYELPPYVPEDTDAGDIESHAVNLNDRDSIFEEAAQFIISGETASTSSIQRRFGVGYNRAGRIMDQLEAAGIVGPSQGGKPRKVLVDSIQLGVILDASK